MSGTSAVVFYRCETDRLHVIILPDRPPDRPFPGEEGAPIPVALEALGLTARGEPFEVAPGTAGYEALCRLWSESYVWEDHAHLNRRLYEDQ
jgi:hypothetical protein